MTRRRSATCSPRMPSTATSRGPTRSSAASAIVADWLKDKDEPGSWTAHYDVWTFDGDRASAIGESRYTNPDGSFQTLYYNHLDAPLRRARPLRRVRRVLHGAAGAAARRPLTARPLAQASRA